METFIGWNMYSTKKWTEPNFQIWFSTTSSFLCDFSPRHVLIIAIPSEKSPKFTWGSKVEALTVPHFFPFFPLIIYNFSSDYLFHRLQSKWRKQSLLSDFFFLVAVSHSFGYGMMDAYAMVKLARTWRRVPPQQTCHIPASHFNKKIPAKSQVNLALEIKPSDCPNINYLEHVQVSPCWARDRGHSWTACPNYVVYNRWVRFLTSSFLFFKYMCGTWKVHWWSSVRLPCSSWRLTGG